MLSFYTWTSPAIINSEKCSKFNQEAAVTFYADSWMKLDPHNEPYKLSAPNCYTMYHLGSLHSINKDWVHWRLLQNDLLAYHTPLSLKF